METNAGIAFEHVHRLDLLAGHLGEQLCVVDDVHMEWANWGEDRPAPISAYATPGEREVYVQKVRVHEACRRLQADAVSVLGPAVELGVSEADAVNDLRRELALLPVPTPPPSASEHWKDRGECTSVRAADLREPPAVLVTNDGKASRLAFNHGIAARTTAELLREMVGSPDVDLVAEDAWALHQRMMEVARIPAPKMPTGPEFFAAPA